MHNQTVAVLGTARNEFVLAAAVALRDAGASVTVLVRRDREARFVADGFPVRTFSGRTEWYSLPLLTALRGVGAKRIVVVVGDQFAHANVTGALNWWRAAGLLRGADIYASLSTQPAVLECFDTVDQRQRLAAAAATLLLVALSILYPVVILVAAAVAAGLELAARRARGWPAVACPAGPASAWPLLVHDPHLGWRLRPVNITARASTPGAAHRTIRVTVDADGQRTTGHPRATADSRPAIAFYGGSFVFGESLSDEETLPWQAAALLAEYRVLNRAVPGYRTVQVLMRVLHDITARSVTAAVVIVDGHEAAYADADSSRASGHARFPLTERCAVWWWGQDVWTRSKERRWRARALMTIGERRARQRIPIVLAVAGADRTRLGPLLARYGLPWTTIDAGASHHSIAGRLAQDVRAALEQSRRP